MNALKKYNISSACMVDGDDLSFDFNIYKQNKTDGNIFLLTINQLQAYL